MFSYVDDDLCVVSYYDDDYGVFCFAFMMTIYGVSLLFTMPMMYDVCLFEVDDDDDKLCVSFF